MKLDKFDWISLIPKKWDMVENVHASTVWVEKSISGIMFFTNYLDWSTLTCMHNNVKDELQCVVRGPAYSPRVADAE